MSKYYIDLRKEENHSFFLGAIIENYPQIIPKLFGIQLPQDSSITTETEVNYTKRNEIDLEIIFDDKKIIIENKFKCFPYREQLERYNEATHSISKEIIIGQYVFCFDKYLNYDLPNNWTIVSYYDILEALKSINTKDKYVVDYINELSNYVNTYNKLINDNFELFNLFTHTSKLEKINDQIILKNLNFWKRLIYENIKLEINNIKQYNGVLDVNRDIGDTTNPLLDIYVNNKKWKLTDNPEDIIFIQFQEGILKLYCRYKEYSIEVENKIKAIIDVLDLPDIGQYKEIDKIRSYQKSCYIYKHDVTSLINKTNFNIKSISNHIINFYNSVDKAIKTL